MFGNLNSTCEAKPTGGLFGNNLPTGSLFGNPSATTGTSLFGGKPTGSLFGDNKPTGSLFGDSKPTNSLFGNTTSIFSKPAEKKDDADGDNQSEGNYKNEDEPPSVVLED